MKLRHLELPQEIWKDKRIPKETKLIYSYIYSKGFDKFIIKNEGLRKSLARLEKLKYLIYKEYANGMYIIKLN